MANSYIRPMDSGGYRTVCVRACDGYFFPISFSTSPSRFDADAQQCRSMCGGAETELFVFKMPDESVENARNLSGRAYSDLPNAMRYQREFVPGCACQARNAGSMLHRVREEKAAARLRDARTSDEARLAVLSPRYKDATDAGLSTTGPVLSQAGTDPSTLRDAATGIRDVYTQPGIDEAAMPRRHVISFETFPPLPIRRPDPVSGKQFSAAR